MSPRPLTTNAVSQMRNHVTIASEQVVITHEISRRRKSLVKLTAAGKIKPHENVR